MPLRYGFIAQASDGGRVDLFNPRLRASRTPELNATRRVLVRGFEIAHEVERACQSAVGPYRERGVILLLCQRVNAFSNLHRCRQRVSVKGMVPLTHQDRIQGQGTIKRMTQGLGALVTNA